MPLFRGQICPNGGMEPQPSLFTGEGSPLAAAQPLLEFAKLASKPQTPSFKIGKDADFEAIRPNGNQDGYFNPIPL